MKKTMALLGVLVMVGCSSKIVYGPSGTMEASNYTISENETFDPNGKITNRTTTKVPFVPDRWYSDALDKLAPLLNQVLGMYKALYPPPQPAPPPAPTPTPTPAPTPAPTPTPTPYPPPTPEPSPLPPLPAASTVYSRTGNAITLNMDTLPGSMRKANFNGRDNALFYAMSNIYKRGPGPALSVKEGDSELARLSDQREAIYRWFDAETDKVVAVMQADSWVTVIAITNDGPDRLGCRLGPAITRKLQQFSHRVSLGNVLPEP